MLKAGVNEIVYLAHVTSAIGGNLVENTDRLVSSVFLSSYLKSVSEGGIGA